VQGVSNSRDTGQLSIAPQAALRNMAGITVTELFCPRLRRWTPQPAGSDCPGRPKSGHHSAPFQRRRLGFVGWRWRDCAGKRSDPAKSCGGVALGLAWGNASGT